MAKPRIPPWPQAIEDLGRLRPIWLRFLIFLSLTYFSWYVGDTISAALVARFPVALPLPPPIVTKPWWQFW